MINSGIHVDGVVNTHVHLLPDRLMTAIREALNF